MLSNGRELCYESDAWEQKIIEHIQGMRRVTVGHRCLAACRARPAQGDARAPRELQRRDSAGIGSTSGAFAPSIEV
jgi:hypothetical protein